MLQLPWSTTLGDPGAQAGPRDPPLFLGWREGREAIRKFIVSRVCGCVCDYVRRMCGCNCASTGREMILLHLCTAFTDPTNAACLYTGRDGVR